MKKKIIRIKACALIIIMMSLIMTGCRTARQDKKATDTYTQEENSETEKENGGTDNREIENSKTENSETQVNNTRDDVVIYSELVPDTLDQHKSVTVATAIYIRNLYANLYRLDTDGNIIPELAESYSVNDDYTEYTVTLKDGIMFSDGSPITAEDVVYTYRRGMASDVTYYEELKKVEARDEKTVVITLNQPNNEFLNDLTVEYMCVMSKAAIEGGMDVAAHPDITSGAYTVEEWKLGESIVLKANPYYFDGEPDIKTAKIIFTLPEENAYQALKKGEVDYLTAVSIDQVPYLQADDDVELIAYDNFAWNFMMLNEQDSHFADQKVRNAIYYALDLNYIIDTALDGRGTPAPLPVNGSIAGYMEGCNAAEYNLNKAKKCMAESSYPDGFDMTIKVSNDEREKVAGEIGTLLSEIGIRVNIEKEDINQLLSEITKHSYEAAITSYSMSSGTVTHAAPLFHPGDSLNFAASTESEISELLLKASSVDPEKKTELLSKAYQLMKEKNIYIGLYWPTIYDAKSVKLKQKNIVTSEKFIIANMYWE